MHNLARNPYRRPQKGSKASSREQALIHSARQVFFEIDREGTWTFLNPAWSKITGLSVDKTLKTLVFNYVYADDRQQIRTQLQRLIQGRLPRLQGEVRFLTSCGQYRWLEIDAQPLRDRQDQVESLIGTLTDITDRKQAETAVGLLQTLIQDISNASDFNSALKAMLSQVCETTHWDYGEAWVIEGKRLTLSPVWYCRTEDLGMFRQLSLAYASQAAHDLPGQILRSGKSHWLYELAKQPASQFVRVYIAREVGFQVGFGVPVVANGQVLAALGFFMLSARSEDESFGEVVTTVAAQLGTIVQNKQAEEAVRRAEEKYRSIFENASEGIFQVTPKGQYLSVNPAMARILGYESPRALVAAFAKSPPQIYVDARLHAEYMAILTHRGKVSAFEAQVYRQDGSIIWVAESARAVRDAKNKVLYYEGTMIDITERKEAESALENSLSLVSATFESMSDGILVVDLQGNLLNYNQRFVEMWRLPSAAMATCEARRLAMAAQMKDPEGFLRRVLMLNDNPEEMAFDLLEFKDGRIFERYSQPQRVGDRTVGRVINFRDVTAQKQAELDLRKQKEQTERLLLNILPAPIAERLKQENRRIADIFPDVTVMFADIVNFSKFADHLPPNDLVDLLNDIFSTFDLLASHHGLEKIKTIGDAYMVVGGLPRPRADHAEAIADMALDMQQHITRFSTHEGSTFKLRIGIHSGPVVAGVIGIKKFSYDLWGDTVNVASRMESQGIPGCIQISARTYSLLAGKYELHERGLVDVKGKGNMLTYLLGARI